MISISFWQLNCLYVKYKTSPGKQSEDVDKYWKECPPISTGLAATDLTLQQQYFRVASGFDAPFSMAYPVTHIGLLETGRMGS